jgi:putative spermidine/putrescine transport system substrate-binding protein
MTTTRLLACAGFLALAPAMLAGARADERKPVYFLSWGGTVQQTLEKEGYAKRFTEATGYTVILVPKSTGPEIVAAAIAQKDNPQVDVVQTDLLPFLAGDDQGIFAPLDATEIPNLAKMPALARVRDGRGVLTYGDLFAIIYNEAVFKKNHWAPPKPEWIELERPEFAGKLVLPPVNTTYGIYALIQLARNHGGSETNIEPGMVALKKLAPGVVEWPTTFARMGEFLQEETAAVGFYTDATAAEMARRGIPVEHVVPKPLVFSGFAAGIMKHAPNPEGAHAFLNWLIGKDFLSHRMERYGNITLSSDVPSKDVSADDVAKMQPIDFDKVNAERATWVARFESEILTAK